MVMKECSFDASTEYGIGWLLSNDKLVVLSLHSLVTMRRIYFCPVWKGAGTLCANSDWLFYANTLGSTEQEVISESIFVTKPDTSEPTML